MKSIISISYSLTLTVIQIPEWDRTTNSLIALTQMLQPTARGKKNAAREKTKNIVQKLIVFIKVRIFIFLTMEKTFASFYY